MNLDDRMKAYEEPTRMRLPIRMPVVIRCDGKAFHTLTANLARPFDRSFREAMGYAAIKALEDIPARMAYHQSDEVSFLLIDYNRFDSEQWFGGIVQKMASVAASAMTAGFVERFGKRACFDARVFVVPERDIVNYFIWRQRDCIRNFILAVGQAHYSPKQMHGMTCDKIIEKLVADGIALSDYPQVCRYGSIVTREALVTAEPNIADDIQKFLVIEEG